MNHLLLSPSAIGQAAEAIRAGEVVAYPTETVYGLAVDPTNESAIERLHEIKGREKGKGILLLASDIEAVTRVVKDVTALHTALSQAFWPGPLSLIFEARDDIHPLLCGRTGQVCVRISSCEAARDLAAAAGGLITSTSANPSGRTPAVSPDEIDLLGIACILDGGRCEGGQPSTVYDPIRREVLREGAITAEALEAACNAARDP